ncbi:MAG: T9SS type A sorting domain-containing protein [Ignavibacteria bacterium]|nr:T9SS type A sorting domain-containing protein [Ignavibacteria bacterium]
MKYISFLTLILLGSILFAQPRKEVRAVWVTTAGRADFPFSVGASAQRAEIDGIVNVCKNANLNTIVFQVSARGDAYYSSSFLPWASNLTCFTPCQDPSNLGFNPGYNPLAEMILKARQQNIEVHAWINAYYVISDTLSKYLSVITFPPHPAIIDSSNGQRYWKTRWFAKTSTGQMKSDGGFFLDPGNPDVRHHLVNIATEIVKNYNIDGIHFDFIRYTDLGAEALLFGDASNYWFTNRTDSLNGNPWNLPRNDFARLNIERMVKMTMDSVKHYKPWVKVGATTPGVYTAAAMGLSCGVWELYNQLRSDPKAWAAKGYIDYHNPQVYWNIATCPEFTKISNWWKNNLSGKQTWLGLASYRIGEPNFGDINEIKNQINYSRTIGASGVNFFRFRSMASSINYFDSLTNSLYKYPANQPPMIWKDPVPPNKPNYITIQKITSDRFRIAWTRPQTATDGEIAEYYNIFRATSPIDPNKAEHLYKITSNPDTFYFDIIPDTNSVYYYAVSAFDKVDNESEISNTIATNIEIDYENYPTTINLSQNYPNPFNPLTKIDFEIYLPGLTTLKVYDMLGREIAALVNENLSAGKYSVEFNSNIYNLPSGIYYYRLTNSGSSITKSFVLLK